MTDYTVAQAFSKIVLNTHYKKGEDLHHHIRLCLKS